jgi:hypothetical protein
MDRTQLQQPRQPTPNALPASPAALAADAAAAHREAGIYPSPRPETLQLNEMARLADLFVSVKKRAVL